MMPATARLLIPRLASQRYDEAYRRLERRIHPLTWALPRRYWLPLVKRCSDAAQRISLKRLDKLCDHYLPVRTKA